MGEIDYKRMQERAREIINNWPEYKRMSIVRNGEITPWIREGPEAVDLAWAAGFFDGEGYLGIVRIKNHGGNTIYYLNIQVSNTNQLSVEKFKSIFGGSIQKSQVKYQGVKKPIWIWKMSLKSAEESLRKMRPYLIVKAEQVDIALEYRETMIQRGRKTKLTDEEVQKLEGYYWALRNAKKVNPDG